MALGARNIGLGGKNYAFPQSVAAAKRAIEPLLATAPPPGREWTAKLLAYALKRYTAPGTPKQIALIQRALDERS